MTDQHRHLPLLDSGCGPQRHHGDMDHAGSIRGADTAHVRAYLVAGMSCGHCVQAVTEEVTKIDGVRQVQLALVPGGASRLSVTSDRPISTDQVSAALTEAGYQLTGEATS